MAKSNKTNESKRQTNSINTKFGVFNSKFILQTISIKGGWQTCDKVNKILIYIWK